MNRREHWDKVYAEQAENEVSWFQPTPAMSLKLFDALGLDSSASVIDVGAGTSRLVDELLDRGYRDISVLDVSQVALDSARERLGVRAAKVQWIVGDITSVDLPPARFDAWHDRAAFHFLTSANDRRQYVQQATSSIKPGGHLILSTFSDDGPDSCSGLPVARYGPRQLSEQVGPAFALGRHETGIHVTPWGARQRFLYCDFILNSNA
jgi:SAM-dependent methyltransferase